jgi:hypothetical protein
VVLINDPADVSILPRLRAELGELGLDVRQIEKKSNEVLPRDLVEAARRMEAIVAFRVLISNKQVDVWIADRVTGKVVLREILSNDGGGLDERVVALRAVELLRVSLMELSAPHQSRGEIAAPAEVATSASLWEEWDRYSLGLNGVVLWSPGGSRPGLGALISFAWHPSWLGVRLAGGSALEPAQFIGPEGRGEITTRWATVNLTMQPALGWSKWRPRFTMGATLLATHLRGIAQAPRTASQNSILTVAPTINADIGWVLHRNFHVVLGIHYLRPLESAKIVFDERDVGLFGKHILFATLGLDFIFP